jgi:hypothetical protein
VLGVQPTEDKDKALKTVQEKSEDVGRKRIKKKHGGGESS